MLRAYYLIMCRLSDQNVTILILVAWTLRGLYLCYVTTNKVLFVGSKYHNDTVTVREHAFLYILFSYLYLLFRRCEDITWTLLTLYVITNNATSVKTKCSNVIQ